MKKYKMLNRAKILFPYMCMGIATLFFMLTSDINPWSKVLPHYDSAIFLSHGVKMAKGEILYVDMWDHKGPILFFIQYLGIIFTPHSLIGIWILECIACFTTIIYMYKTAKLFSKNTLVCLISSIFPFFSLYYWGEQGNCVEQWALPFISYALYIFNQYIKEESIANVKILFAGVAMGCVFLMNGNLVTVWIAYIPVIFILLIYRKQFKELKRCIVYFSIGLILLLLVTSIVLVIQGAFGAFLNTYFGFNSEYVSGNSVVRFKNLVLNSFYGNTFFAYSQFLLGVIIMVKYKNKEMKAELCALFYTIIALLMANMSPRGYSHYYIQYIPCMLIPLSVIQNEVSAYFRNDKKIYIVVLLWIILFGRYRLTDFYVNKVQTIIGEGNDMFMAGGDTENYTIVNEWLGNPWSDEDIDKWVTNEIY